MRKLENLDIKIYADGANFNNIIELKKKGPFEDFVNEDYCRFIYSITID